jgi:hypothetical protein
MNPGLQALLSALLPFLQQIGQQLLTDPKFQAVITSIIADGLAKIGTGVHPDTAANQAMRQVASAASLHLTGNPIADAQAWLASFNAPLPPTPPPTIQYKS